MDGPILQKLNALGLSDEEATAYLVLVEFGPTGALGLSRQLHRPRTNVYRIVDNLRVYGLVDTQPGTRGMVIVARPPDALEDLVGAHKRNVEYQSELLPSLMGELTNLSGKGPLGSRIVYYEGLAGLKQVTINSLEARTGLCIYELANMTSFVEAEHAEEIRREVVRRKIHHRQLTNMVSFPGFTAVTEIAEFWEVRYLDPKELEIEFEILIYNDVYALYTYRNGEVFCAEIRSPALASMQRNLFDLVWSRAKRMRVTGEGLAMEVTSAKRPTRRR